MHETIKQAYAGKRVLITGGCGFIGSHLAQALIACGAHVTILDNLATGRLENIEPFKQHVTFLRKSITDPHACLEATSNQDFVFHLAAFISVPLSLEQPSLCHQVNVEGTFNMLEAARLNGVKNFIFSSSSAVYGASDTPCSENMPCAPTSPYGFAKRIGELYCQQYATAFNLHTVCLRYFNVYGPRQRQDGAYAAVVAKFNECLERNAPITVFGDGTQTRDFVHVDDVVLANLRLGLLPPERMRGEAFNIASGTSITLLELIDTLKKDYPAYTGSTLFAPARDGDVHHSAADCRKYQQVSGS